MRRRAPYELRRGDAAQRLDLRLRAALPGAASELRGDAPSALPGRLRRAVDAARRERRLQPRWSCAAGLHWRQVDGAARLRQVPAPGRRPPSARPTWRTPSWPTSTPRRLLVSLFEARFDPALGSEATRAEADRRAAGGAGRPALDAGRHASTTTGSCAPSSTRHQGHAAHQPLPGTQAGQPPICRSSSTRSRSRTCPRRGRRTRSGCTRPRVEGVHLRFGDGRPRRPALVGPPGGLPHRDPRPGQGADGQERRDRPGRRQGRLRRQAAARPAGDRDAWLAEGRPATGSSSRGLLDITDNLVGPDGDGRAAGATWSATTATTPTSSSPPTRAPRPSPTSPTSVALEYGFWLGDAFASGGSVGYDHKAMGITARGAWESVKRHFRELGLDTQTAGLHRRRHRRHVAATCSATACCCREHIRLRRRLRPPARLPRPGPGRRRPLRRARSASSTCPAPRGRTTTAP